MAVTYSNIGTPMLVMLCYIHNARCCNRSTMKITVMGTAKAIRMFKAVKKQMQTEGQRNEESASTPLSAFAHAAFNISTMNT